MKAKTKKTLPDKIRVGSTYFVSETKMVLDSLFSPEKGKTASGTFEIKEKGVLFKDEKGDVFAFLAMHTTFPFFVSCSRRPNGRLFYMHGLCSLDGAKLGLAGLTHRQENEEAERVGAEIADLELI